MRVVVAATRLVAGFRRGFHSVLLLNLLLSLSLGLATVASAGLYDQPSAYAASSENGIGAVASVHPLATQAGLDVLQSGGNAIDAAVAVALTLGVVDGHNSGIGGGCFAVVRYADGRIEALDGREMAPAAAHRDMYVRDGQLDKSLSKVGALASGVPGSLAVFDYLLNTAGKKSLAEVILPAATIAEQGFPLSRASAGRLQGVADSLRRFPGTAAVLLDKQGQPWPAGHQLIQADLAATYRQIAKHGIEYFYGGEFAVSVDTWMQANGGILRQSDFADYKMLRREPVLTEYRGYQIVGFPPPSSGGVHVGQILNMLENFDVAKLTEAERYHLLVEAMRLAFADRAHYLGDPDFVPVPKGLISQAYADQLASKIDINKATVKVEYGVPPGVEVDFFGKHTTHISTADQYGNWVSITTTVNTSFGSKVIVPGTGVVLNNQMDDFSIQPGVPNAFGLVGSEANSVQAGKRPLSSMSPTLVLKEGKPLISVGAAGGPTIITQVVQALVNVIDLDLPVQEALALPRVHHQWKPEFTMVEKTLPASVKKSLREKGHKLYPRSYSGTTQMIKAAGKGFDAQTEPRVIERNLPER